jgi:hypothetical protein
MDWTLSSVQDRHFSVKKMSEGINNHSQIGTDHGGTRRRGTWEHIFAFR